MQTSSYNEIEGGAGGGYTEQREHLAEARLDAARPVLIVRGAPQRRTGLEVGGRAAACAY